MARIRSIKPEFWTSEQVVECSTNARLLFIGMWNFCDDCGRHPYSPRRLKMCVFPGDDGITTDDVEALMQELVMAELIVPYSVNGDGYFVVSGWSHQKIDRPQPTKWPAPEDGQIIPLAEIDSTNAHRTLADDSSLIGKERIGEEGKGKESSRPRTPAITAAEVQLPSGWQDTPEVRAALHDWLEHKHAKGERYKSAESVGKMLTTFANRYGANAQRTFLESVPFSIGNNYSGCFAPKSGKAAPSVGAGQQFDPTKGKLEW